MEVTVGLEIHAELNTRSKMFCSCANDPQEKHPNINVCPVCMGHPGTLPVINKKAVKKVVKTGVALNCQIPEYSKFDRKSYFYPDLPKGYQISQYDKPLCKKGFLKIGGRKIRIKRVHLEEDTGRLIHPQGKEYSLIDFNRAGVPLMELVTEPDLKSAIQAKKFAQELRLILRYLDVSEADMEKGQLRIEANISIAPKTKSSRSSKENELGTKVEIKNLNSFRAVEKAIEYEIERQNKILESDKEVTQETRGWDSKKEKTVSQRKKEESFEYRYFPEPDLPPLHGGTPDYLKEVKAEIPELPADRRERFEQEYGLPPKKVEVFVVQKDLGEYFEKVISELKNWIKTTEFGEKISDKEFSKLINLTSNYLLTELQGLLKGSSVEGEDFLITPENFAEFITMIYRGKISSKIGKKVLKEMFSTGADPSQIVKEKDLTTVTDTSEIKKIAQKVISDNPRAVKDFKQGKENAIQFLMGQMMRESKGKVEPQTALEILKKILKKG